MQQSIFTLLIPWLDFSLIWIRATFVAGTYKRLNIEYDKTMLTNSSEDIQHDKETENARGS